MVVHNVGGGHHQGDLEEDRGCGGRECSRKKQRRKDEEEIEVEFRLVVEEL